MTSLSIKVCFFAVICIAASVTLRQLRPEFPAFLRIASVVAIGSLAVSVILPIVTYLASLFDGDTIGNYGGMVLKALGTAFLVQICADICRDSGEGSLASGVELIGKLEILLLCIPLLEDILGSVREVMAWS